MKAALCLFFFMLANLHSADAHRVNIFAWVQHDQVHVECNFSRNHKVYNGKITVADASTNVELLAGKTDADGVFLFPVSAAMKKAGHDLRIRIFAGEGHQNDWILPAEQFTDSAGNAEQPASSAEAKALPESPDAVQKANLQSAALTKADVEEIINRAMDAKLAPVMRMLGENLTAEPSLKDIIGGIGWIFGIAGAVLLCRKRH